MRAWQRAAVAIAAAGGVAITIWLATSGGTGHSDVTPTDVLSGRAAAIEAKERAMDEERKAALAALARQEEAKRAAAAHRRDALASLFGARPGQPGPLLTGVHFDHDEPVPVDVRGRLDDFERATGAQVYVFANSFDGVRVTFDSDDGVIDALTRAWGPVPADGAWIDEPDRLTASHDHRVASVSWQAFQTVDDLIKPSDPDRFGFEPSPLVGANRDVVRPLLHAGDRVSDYELDMTMPHLAGALNGPVHVTFELEHEAVTSMTITTQAPQAATAVLEALRLKYGSQHAPWHHAGLTITLTTDTDGSTIRVEGKRR